MSRGWSRAARVKVLTVAVVSCAAWWLYAAAPAVAAPYTVYSCQAPGGKQGTADGWSSVQQGLGTYAGLDCPRGPLVAGVDRTRAHSRGTYFGFKFSAPSGTRIRDYSIQRRVILAGGPGSWAYNYTLLFDTLDFTRRGEQCWALDACYGLGEAQSAQGNGLSLGSLTALVDCSSGSTSDCPAGAAPTLQIYLGAIHDG